jgi:hypothetical protein
MRIVALLEHHTMQEVFDAIEASTQGGTDDPAAIALILKQGTQPYNAHDDSLRVFDSEDWRIDRYNLHHEHVTPPADLELNDID